ncbi:RnfH family protein [Pantoea sp. Mhis]|uniref:RnfH family protein n=1 Tax=Pantoea sp. Mhis TaxID=2576759 RepID=UPI001358EA82|nr:RnfH family protein [Pantoea sp. Mhis]MXP56617.1 RnfH family protein [Pantoea sp. Mhis]
MTHINVTIVYALIKKQYILNMKLKLETTIEEAIKASGILILCKEIDLRKNKVGIFGKLIKLTNLVQDGDRIEIYRPLISHSKELRYKRIVKNSNIEIKDNILIKN